MDLEWTFSLNPESQKWPVTISLYERKYCSFCCCFLNADINWTLASEFIMYEYDQVWMLEMEALQGEMAHFENHYAQEYRNDPPSLEPSPDMGMQFALLNLRVPTHLPSSRPFCSSRTYLLRTLLEWWHEAESFITFISAMI